MEIMRRPNEPTLVFLREVFPWTVSQEETPDGIKYIFKKETPKEVLEKFDAIKNKLSYKVA